MPVFIFAAGFKFPQQFLDIARTSIRVRVIGPPGFGTYKAPGILIGGFIFDA